MRNNRYFILNENGDPISMTDAIGFAQWFEKANRHLAKTELSGFYISTVFLGINHAFGGGDPVLWETMIFGLTGDDEYQDRHTNKRDALLGHIKAIEFVLELMK